MATLPSEGRATVEVVGDPWSAWASASPGSDCGFQTTRHCCRFLLKQFNAGEVLRVDDSERPSLVVHHDEVVDPVVLQNVQHFSGQPIRLAR